MAKVLNDNYNMNKIKQKILVFQTVFSKIPRIREKLAKKYILLSKPYNPDIRSLPSEIRRNVCYTNIELIIYLHTSAT